MNCLINTKSKWCFQVNTQQRLWRRHKAHLLNVCVLCCAWCLNFKWTASCGREVHKFNLYQQQQIKEFISDKMMTLDEKGATTMKRNCLFLLWADRQDYYDDDGGDGGRKISCCHNHNKYKIAAVLCCGMMTEGWVNRANVQICNTDLLFLWNCYCELWQGSYLLNWTY